MNEKVNNVIKTFLSGYVDKDYFLGAILTGSYATGNNDANSDIDIFIIAKDSINWRERGNKLIDGYLVEYFINPVRQIDKELNESTLDNNMSTVMMFKNSKILYDNFGMVKSLVDKANDKFKQDIDNISDYQYKMNCYSVWNSFDELDSKYKNNEDIDYSYYIFLNETINAYFRNNRIPLLPINKIEKILMNDDFRKRYQLKKLPNKEFLDLLIKCFKEKDYNKKYFDAKDLYIYFMNNSKNFDINDFAVRSFI